jgi:hypothetical protein
MANTRSRLAQVQYGDLPALASSRPRLNPDQTFVSGRRCAVATIPLDQLEAWTVRHNLRPVRAIGNYWPPVIYYEEIPDGN